LHVTARIFGSEKSKICLLTEGLSPDCLTNSAFKR
jgi:hypothetical protein